MTKWAYIIAAATLFITTSYAQRPVGSGCCFAEDLASNTDFPGLNEKVALLAVELKRQCGFEAKLENLIEIHNHLVALRFSSLSNISTAHLINCNLSEIQNNDPKFSCLNNAVKRIIGELIQNKSFKSYSAVYLKLSVDEIEHLLKLFEKISGKKRYRETLNQQLLSPGHSGFGA